MRNFDGDSVIPLDEADLGEYFEEDAEEEPAEEEEEQDEEAENEAAVEVEAGEKEEESEEAEEEDEVVEKKHRVRTVKVFSSILCDIYVDMHQHALISQRKMKGRKPAKRSRGERTTILRLEAAISDLQKETKDLRKKQKATANYYEAVFTKLRSDFANGLARLQVIEETVSSMQAKEKVYAANENEDILQKQFEGDSIDSADTTTTPNRVIDAVIQYVGEHIRTDGSGEENEPRNDDLQETDNGKVKWGNTYFYAYFHVYYKYTSNCTHFFLFSWRRSRSTTKCKMVRKR